MRIAPQIIAALKADPTVSSMVGNKVFADYPPQGTEEPMVIMTITNTNAHGTVTNCNVRAYSARITVDIIAPTRALTENGMDAIEDVLVGMTSSDSGYPIQGITPDSGTQWEVLNPRDGSDERAMLCSQDYQVHYRRN